MKPLHLAAALGVAMACAPAIAGMTARPSTTIHIEICYRFEPLKDLTAYELLVVSKNKALVSIRVSPENQTDADWILVKRHFQPIDCPRETK